MFGKFELKAVMNHGLFVLKNRMITDKSFKPPVMRVENGITFEADFVCQ